MTPAIDLLVKRKISHDVLQYEHDTDAESFGSQVVEKLKLSPQLVFKTLVVKLDTGALCVAVLPVERMLSMKLLAKAVAAKKAQMADKIQVERTTGYVLGGVSPLAQKKSLLTVIDESACSLSKMYVSAGKRGVEIALQPRELASLVKGTFFPISQ